MKRLFNLFSYGIIFAALLLMAGIPVNPVPDAQAYTVEDGSFRLTGYFRTWAAFNLEDVPETKKHDRWTCNMLRGSILVDAEGRTPGGVLIKGIARFDGEIKTSYLRRLESEIDDLSQQIMNIYQAGGQPRYIEGDGHDLMDQYNNNEMREAYIEFNPIERVMVRFGKQQVVWGETDFFRAMDLVHGYDYRWRMFMEPENEELRKPLIILNTMIQVPELNGSLQLLFRPGWDQKEDIGNRFAVEAGRWLLQPYRGLDFTALLDYDYHYQYGDSRDRTYGARWTGQAGPVEYSFAFLRTYNPEFVINSTWFPYRGEKPTGIVGDFVHPLYNLIGFTANGYVPFMDAVLSTEIVYHMDKPFSSGSSRSAYDALLGMTDAEADAVAGAFAAVGLLPAGTTFKDIYPDGGYWVHLKGPGGAPLRLADGWDALVGGPGTAKGLPVLLDLPGFGPQVHKDMLTTMFRIDKSLYFLPFLQTCEAPFASIQIFDDWIQNFDDDDQIVYSSPFGCKRKEHTTLLTAVISFQYRNKSVNPFLAGGIDLTNGGGFFFPSCEFTMGNHWRLRLEADLFFSNGKKDMNRLKPFGQNNILGDALVNPGIPPVLNALDPGSVTGNTISEVGWNNIQSDHEQNAGFFGYFDHADQFMIRLTYLF